MIIIMFGLVGLSLMAGILIGSGLHIRAVSRRYRQVAQLVQQLYEQEEALAEERWWLEHRGTTARDR